MKPEVKEVPELIRLDAEIRRLQGRIGKLEQMMQMALQHGGPHWVDQVVRVGRELESIVGAVTIAVHKLNSLKARWSSGRPKGRT